MRFSDETAYVVIARLEIIHGQEQAFAEFERKAIFIMEEYEGKLVSAIRTVDQETITYTDIHILEFPEREAFEAYRKDKRLLELSEERKRCVSHTCIEFGKSISY